MRTIDRWLSGFKHLQKKLMINIFLSLVIMMVVRFSILMPFVNESLFSQHSNELFRAFSIGFLYDLRVSTILFLPLFLLSVAAASLHRKGLFPVFNHISAIILVVTLFLSIANFYYCRTYERHFDTFIFGLFEEDTLAVLSNIWDDYPVITVCLATALAYYLCLFLQRKIDTSFTVKKTDIHYLIIFSGVILMAFGYFIAMRGSVGTFPLRRDYAHVSDIKSFNMVTPNGLIALQWAIKDHAKLQAVPHVSDVQGARLWQQLSAETTPDFNVDKLITHTPKDAFLAENKPNVVFAVMESFGSHLLSYDSPTRDMLGALRPHWQKDYVFTRFLSEGNGTMDSLARFFIRSPLFDVPLTQARKYHFAGDVITPYKANGYKVVYATSGNLAWRNLAEVLPAIGFDELVDQNSLMKLYPGIKADTWGVADEYLFKYVEQRLLQAEQDKQPVFIMTMSVTNHPPYRTPESYQPRELHVDKTIQSRFSNIPEIKNVFATYTYANDVLGHFLSDIKQSDVGRKTIIGITGDHNIRGLGYPDQSESVIGHAVPFYLYVPERYKRHVVFDPARVGSHKDILPTLYSLSLSDTSYLNMGCNLLAKDLDPVMCQFGYNTEVAITAQGAYLPGGKSLVFQPWSETNSLSVREPQVVTGADRSAEKIEAYRQLLEWQLYRQMQ